MSKLMPLEFKSQRIIITKILAEQYGTDENNIIKNFNNNKSRFIEGKHYFKLQGEELKKFKLVVNNVHDQIISNKTTVLTLWTDRGAARHAKILDTDEAWEVYETLEETYFNIKAKIPNLSKELQAIIMIDEKTVQMDNRILNLENTMTIDYSQQEELRTLATRKVVAILGGKNTPAYKELNKKAFSSIWKDYKRIVDVNSYKNTAVKDLMFARQVIIDWKPIRELELMIKGCNSAR